jgi:hypothetical protein
VMDRRRDATHTSNHRVLVHVDPARRGYSTCKAPP